MTAMPFDELAGPADADMFRMTVDWGRWYIDPLPTCDIAKATDDRWPSFSHVKKAADKDWSFLTVNRLAALEVKELHRIADLEQQQRADAIRSHEKLAKNIAFGRGAIVHLWAEDLAADRTPREITQGWLNSNGYPYVAWEEAESYLRALVDFFQTYQPEPVAAEYVTIHRTLNERGYGATPDGLFRIDGQTVALDWKTRGEGSSHAAYPEEACQIAAGAQAEYMIVRVDDHAERRPMPQIDGGYVVSIKPDGARLYPVDIPKAFEHWNHLHEWWVHKLDEKASIGRVRAKRSAPKEKTWPEQSNTSAKTRQSRSSTEPSLSISSTSTPPEGTSSTPTSDGCAPPAPPSSPTNPANQSDWRFEAKRRYDLLNHDQQVDYTTRKATIDTSDPTQVFALLNTVCPIQQVSVESVKPLWAAGLDIAQPPDEGGPVNQTDVNALKARFDLLPLDGSLWTGTLVAQGNKTHPFRIKDRPTVRRYEIYRGILALAEWLFPNEGDAA